MAEKPMSRLERQKADYDAAVKEAQANVPSAKSGAKVLNSRKNYLDELSNSLDEAGQTASEKTIFQKESMSDQLFKKMRNWWD
jgi:hypothetical protein